MKTLNLIALAGSVMSCSAQDSFENADFNVTEALLKQGVDVSTLPELAGLATRSSDQACSIAVRLSHLIHAVLIRRSATP